MRLVSAFVAATVATLTPVALAAQHPFEGTSASADEILALIESGLRSSFTSSSEFALERAGWYANLFLTQFTGPRANPEHFGPRSQAELDAFADTLVAIAVAHPREHDRSRHSQRVLGFRDRRPAGSSCVRGGVRRA